MGSATANAAWADSNVGAKCMSMSFPTGSIGYTIRLGTPIPAVTLEKTSDGGKTWAPVKTTSAKNPQEAAGTALVFTDATTGFTAVGTPIALGKTTDGGITWTVKTVTGLAVPLNSVRRMSFATMKDGAALVGLAPSGAGSTQVVVTHDAGETWAAVKVPDMTTNYVNVGMADANTLVAFAVRTVTGGEMTGVYTSHDSGATWKKNYEAPVSQPFGTIEFLDPKNGFLSKQCPGGASNDCVMATTDGGDTWTPTTTAYLGSASVYTPALAWADLKNGILGSGGDILRTTDGGKNWTKSVLPASAVGTNWPCLAYPGPGAIAGAGLKTYLFDDAAGGGPRPPLPGGMPPGDAGIDASTPDAPTSDVAPSDASPPDTAGVVADAAPTDAAAPPAADTADSGGCSMSSRATSAGAELVLFSAVLLGLKRRAARSMAARRQRES